MPVSRHACGNAAHEVSCYGRHLPQDPGKGGHLRAGGLQVGVFRMDGEGLHAVPNPSALFLSDRLDTPGVSAAVTVTMEGTRPLLAEIQALCSPARIGGEVCVFTMLHKVAPCTMVLVLILPKYQQSERE